MPNITKMAKHLGGSRDKARNVLNGVTPKKTRNRRKYLDDFEFDFLPSIKHEYFESLLSSDFISRAENIIFIGSPGVGKPPLSIAIVSDVAARRNAVYFMKFSKLIS